MSFFRNLKVGVKIGFCILWLPGTAFTIAVAGVKSMNSLQKESEKVINESFEQIGVINDLTINFHRSQSMLRTYYITPLMRNITLAEINQLFKENQELIAQYDSFDVSQEEKEAFEQLKDSYANYLECCNELITLCNDGKSNQAVRLINNDIPV